MDDLKLFSFTLLCGPTDSLCVAAFADEYRDAVRQLRLLPLAEPIVKLIDDGIEPVSTRSFEDPLNERPCVCRTWINRPLRNINVH
jgi:hypothetical protein